MFRDRNKQTPDCDRPARRLTRAAPIHLQRAGPIGAEDRDPRLDQQAGIAYVQRVRHLIEGQRVCAVVEGELIQHAVGPRWLLLYHHEHSRLARRIDPLQLLVESD